MIVIKKNVVILFGSPNENGHTRKMVDYLKKDLTGYNFFEFNAYNEMIKPCIGCDKCKVNGKCFLDDFAKLEYFFKELNPEILVIASPIYNFGFPAPLKAIIDRFQPYYYTHFKEKNYKKAILLLSLGRKFCYKDEYIKILNIILKPLKFKIEQFYFWDKTDFIKCVKKFQILNFIDDIKK